MVPLIAAELADIRTVTVSTHNSESAAKRASTVLRNALADRGDDADYSIEVERRNGRFSVLVTSSDPDSVVLATCVEALLRSAARG